jgi:hypothetical protein
MNNPTRNGCVLVYMNLECPTSKHFLATFVQENGGILMGIFHFSTLKSMCSYNKHAQLEQKHSDLC